MIKWKLVTLAFLSTVVLGSVFARVGATPMDLDCLETRRATCCHELDEFCQGFVDSGCTICCGQVVTNDPLLVLECSSSGWSQATLFGVDNSGPECVYYRPICVAGACDVESFTTQAYCVGYLEPVLPPDCS